MKKIVQLGLILSLTLSSIFAEESTKKEGQVENVEKVAVDNTPLLKNDHFLTFEFDATLLSPTLFERVFQSGTSFSFMFKLDEKYSVGIRQESMGISLAYGANTAFGNAELKAVVLNYLLLDEFAIDGKKLGRLYVGANIGSALVSTAITATDTKSATIAASTIPVWDAYAKLQRDLSTHGGVFATAGIRYMAIGDSGTAKAFWAVVPLFAKVGFNIGF